MQAAACARGARSRAAASAEAGMRAGRRTCFPGLPRNSMSHASSYIAIPFGKPPRADSSSPEGQTRGWKLFALAPRMLLYHVSSVLCFMVAHLSKCFSVCFICHVYIFSVFFLFEETNHQQILHDYVFELVFSYEI